MANAAKIIPVLISVVVIILIAIVQERSKALAAIIATMPLTAPLAMWIVYSTSKGNQEKVASFTGSMIGGIMATLVFIAACWLGLRLRINFWASMLFGWAAWTGAAFGLPALLKLIR